MPLTRSVSCGYQKEFGRDIQDFNVCIYDFNMWISWREADMASLGASQVRETAQNPSENSGLKFAFSS